MVSLYTRMHHVFITAHKRSLRRLCFYTCLSLCPWGWGVVSQHALQMVSQHALQQVSGGWYPGMPCRFPGQHQGGKLRGLPRGISRPTPGWVSRLRPRGVSPGPHLGGVSRPTTGGCQVHTQGRVCTLACTEADPLDGYCCGRYASYWNAFLLVCIFWLMFLIFLNTLPAKERT